MTEVLPRQTYRTDSHAAAEQEIAEIFAAFLNAKQLKIGWDPRDQQKSRVDRMLYRGDNAIGFFEVKTSSYPFGCRDGWATGRRKLLELQKLYSVLRVPVVFVVRFGCQTVGYVNVNRRHSIIENWGRNDRGDSADREQGARFQWSQFEIVQREATMEAS